MYGKIIIKAIETDTLTKDNKDDFGKCFSFNYDYIGSVLEVNGRYYIKEVKSILSHFNRVHCVAEILSMSKKLMDCVFGCANDCNVKVYYQDTDSIHLNYDDVNTIVNRYKNKYNTDSVGVNT